ncbi:hypothetical protein BTJ68_14733 [Hortaea werneckii EXF-2000]|uniref:Uncharacterized protein n=1 Tax=Hortaea werneckii EXF-2000 TaxID=1157616 RepID=A0A1Z5SNA1_HORWE|nr:hypothetical protein BTJ68_14733 [Hortaea werneckii EXF-2000]
MPPRPFPFALGIGTDICHRKRIEQLLLKPPLKHGRRTSRAFWSVSLLPARSAFSGASSRPKPICFIRN